MERRRLRGRTLVAIASGANMNFDRLRFVAERAELGEQREAILAVTIPERPGSFRRFCALLGPRNVTEFNYRYGDPEKAHVFVGLSIHNRDETAQLVRALARGGAADAGPVGQRDGQAAHPPHGGRALAAGRATRSCTASSSRNGPAR